MNWVTACPLTLPQYSQTPTCPLLGSPSPPTDQWVKARCVPFGNALPPSSAVHGAIMIFCPASVTLGNFPAIALRSVTAVSSFATVSSYQRIDQPCSREWTSRSTGGRSSTLQNLRTSLGCSQ